MQDRAIRPSRYVPAILLWTVVAALAWFLLRGEARSPVIRFTLYRPSVAQFYVDRGAVIGDNLDNARYVTENVAFGVPGDVGLVCPQSVRDDPRGYRVYAKGAWFMFGHPKRPQRGDLTLGRADDLPFCADFDDDGVSDNGVFRDGTWLVAPRRDAAAPLRFSYGTAGDRPVVLNVDGAGNGTDRRNLVYGIYRRGMWYLDTRGSGSADATHVFGGLPQDVPLLLPRWSHDAAAPAYSLAIFRDGIWYLKPDPDGPQVLSFVFGAAGDLPGFVR